MRSDITLLKLRTQARPGDSRPRTGSQIGLQIGWENHPVLQALLVPVIMLTLILNIILWPVVPAALADEVHEKVLLIADPTLAGPQDFVELNSYIPNLLIDMPYATTNNIAGRILYPSNNGYLRKSTADKLKIAARIAAEQGYQLKLWDGYRPQAVQEALWQANPNPDCLVNPATGYSVHTRGAAVDVTLVGQDGESVPMPSGYDDFSALADRDYSDVTARQGADARVLEIIMQQAGFNSIQSEWWHFNDSGYQDLPVVLSLEVIVPSTAASSAASSTPAATASAPSTASAPASQGVRSGQAGLSGWLSLLPGQWAGMELDAAFRAFCTGLRASFAAWLQSLLVSPEPAGAVELEPGQKVVRISAVGDCTLGGVDSFSQQLAANNGDYSYFLGGAAPFLQKDDLTIANLESALTYSEAEANKSHQPAPFYLKGPPEYARILELGSVEAVNLANNHTYDYLQPGFEDTRAALDQQGIIHFGYGEAGIKEINGCQVGMLGYNPQGPLEQGSDADAMAVEMQTAIESLRTRCDLVVVSFHWGEEGSTVPDTLQIRLGHLAVDSGADLVLGHGPHVIQPVEVYKDRCIVYSLGNFVFGGNSNPPDHDSFIFTQQFVMNGENTRALEPMYIPCRISSTPSTNDFRPVAVYGPDSLRIMARLAW